MTYLEASAWRWRLGDFAPGEGLVQGAQRAAYDDAQWLPIDVPGDVHRTLIAAGRIADPFAGRNEAECAWMEAREWWYRAAFTAAAGEYDLLFEGLDTFASVYVNGQYVGEHHNMFRPAQFRSTLVDGANTLAVRFDPPVQRIAGKTLSRWGRNPERTAMRKAQFGFGWDWGPRLPTIGIWRPVHVRPVRAAALAGVHFYTLEASSERACVAVRVEATDEPDLRARVLLGDIETDVPLRGGDGVAYLTVEQPRLWWTHELGEPNLYDLEVRLLQGGTEVDVYQAKVGIRSLTLDQSPDPEERGTRFFRFVLNGVPIFAKGADWIPCDSFVGAIASERYTTLLEQARAANMTMLRIWGGGIYEADQFYSECDRLGILVWQDFMFACAMYAEDDADFVAEVDAEARYQVRRLRSHPCLALWCGNNENQWLHERNFWDAPELPAYGALYYDHVLPRAVAELDGRTPYWPGSPYGGSDHNSRLEGNVHNWEVWHGNYPRQFGEQPRRENTPQGVSYRRYAEDMGRFISEFGMHAAPVQETLWRVVPPDERYQHSPTMDWHNKDNPKNKGDNLLLATTGLPTDLEQYILFSQIAQAEGLKFGLEHFRRRKPHCSGTLVWQLDDCWPVLSWSMIDYYGFPKPSYFLVRRAYAPLLASFKDGRELWLTNDGSLAASDVLSVTLGRFSGETLWQESREVRIDAGGSICVWRLDLPEAAGPEQYLAVRSERGTIAGNRWFFGEYKDLLRVRVAPTMQVLSEAAHELTVQLRAPNDGYVYFASVTTPWETSRYSDNYVDLLPGEATVLTITDRQHELRGQDLRLGWA